MEKVIRVPLSVDAQPKIPVLSYMLPLRGVFLLALCSPLAFLSLTLPFLPTVWRFGLLAFFIVMPILLAQPTKEGIWIGFWLIYKLGYIIMPQVVREGRAKRGVVKLLQNKRMAISNVKDPFIVKNKTLQPLGYYTDLPHVIDVRPGLFALNKGGYRAVIKIKGPVTALSNDAYLDWCHNLVSWLEQVNVPAQFLTQVAHLDQQKAQEAFNDKLSPNTPKSPLYLDELELAGQVAANSLGLEHYIVFAPNSTNAEGLPYYSQIRKLMSAHDTELKDADRILGQANRLSSSFGLEVMVPTVEEVNSMIKRSILGAQEATVSSDLLNMDGAYHVVMAATKLPPRIASGDVVDALMRARCQATASFHIIPVDARVARNALNKQAQMLRYSAKQGGADAGTYLALEDAENVLARLAARNLTAFRMALTFSVNHPEKQKAADAAERLMGIMQGAGFEMQYVTVPGFVPALALSPGGPPLLRNLLLTAGEAIVRMIPALGTPFADSTQPLVGPNLYTGAPAYLDVWKQVNHNAVILGGSGAGKSVSIKTLLMRHVMRGASVLIVDPDSEYKPIMKAIGGNYVELGTDALNPFTAAMGFPPDEGAGYVLTVLSVLAGDEKGVKDGRPIRRLPDEDKGWVHTELADFLKRWKKSKTPREPILSDFIDFLMKVSIPRAISPREKERANIIALRLKRYTQGEKARIFNRPSSFRLDQGSVGIGLSTLANTYQADLTPALAIVLSSVYATMGKVSNRIIIVDEAHRVTSDPDAGGVLNSMIRQVRKQKTGIWMCSQRINDFIGTELGQTLSENASTKLILGSEDTSVEKIAELFKLSPEEKAAINPIVPGRGVLIAGTERAVVRVKPSSIIMMLSDTTNNFVKNQAA